MRGDRVTPWKHRRNVSTNCFRIFLYFPPPAVSENYSLRCKQNGACHFKRQFCVHILINDNSNFTLHHNFLRIKQNFTAKRNNSMLLLFFKIKIFKSCHIFLSFFFSFTKEAYNQNQCHVIIHIHICYIIGKNLKLI